jgi:hypothetical protein
MNMATLEIQRGRSEDRDQAKGEEEPEASSIVEPTKVGSTSWTCDRHETINDSAGIAVVHIPPALAALDPGIVVFSHQNIISKNAF